MPWFRCLGLFVLSTAVSFCASDVSAVAVSRDLYTMMLLCETDDGDCLRVTEAGQAPPEQNDDDEDVDAMEPGPESGLVPLSSRLGIHVRTPSRGVGPCATKGRASCVGNHAG